MNEQNKIKINIISKQSVSLFGKIAVAGCRHAVNKKSRKKIVGACMTQHEEV